MPTASKRYVLLNASSGCVIAKGPLPAMLRQVDLYRRAYEAARIVFVPRIERVHVVDALREAGL